MKKVLSILLIIMLIITFIQIRNMYALYKEQLSGEYSTSLGKWNVKVNGTNIVSPGEVVEFEMLDGNVEYLDNDFKSAGAYIVPNTEAFFDILFDTSNTQVAVKYIIEFDEINSYNVINNETGNFVVDTTDDLDGDASEEDYEFALKYPLKFEMQEITDLFGNYSLSSEVGKEGMIVGTETAEEYEKKTKIDKENFTVTGVIPLEVSQANLQNRLRIKFKWLIDEDTIAEENRDEYEDMYQYMMSRNNETESVKLVIPIKVKAIQYFGEDL